MQQKRLHTVHTIFDHASIIATFGPQIERRKTAMKDYVLGSVEYIIRSTELIEEMRRVYGINVDQQEDADEAAQQQQQANQGEVHNSQLFTNTDTGETALHVFNMLISRLEKLHNTIAKEKAQKDRKKTI
jgi:hypothetical protein